MSRVVRNIQLGASPRCSPSAYTDLFVAKIRAPATTSSGHSNRLHAWCTHAAGYMLRACCMVDVACLRVPCLQIVCMVACCCVLYAECCALRAACCALRAACCMFQIECCVRVACCALHVVCGMLRVACCMLRVCMLHACMLHFMRA